MAVTATYSGSLALTLLAAAAFSGDREGSEVARQVENVTFAAAGGTAPTISGFLKGTATCAAGDWLLAHATDPLQGQGDAAYSEGFTVASSKIKALLIVNEDTTNSITLARAAANGLPIFGAAGDAVTLQPGGMLLLLFPTGTAALTTGSNDALTVGVSGGSPQATVLVFYGP